MNYYSSRRAAGITIKKYTWGNPYRGFPRSILENFILKFFTFYAIISAKGDSDKYLYTEFNIFRSALILSVTLLILRWFVLNRERKE